MVVIKSVIIGYLLACGYDILDRSHLVHLISLETKMRTMQKKCTGILELASISEEFCTVLILGKKVDLVSLLLGISGLAC